MKRILLKNSGFLGKVLTASHKTLTASHKTLTASHTYFSRKDRVVEVVCACFSLPVCREVRAVHLASAAA